MGQGVWICRSAGVCRFLPSSTEEHCLSSMPGTWKEAFPMYLLSWIETILNIFVDWKNWLKCSYIKKKITSWCLHTVHFLEAFLYLCKRTELKLCIWTVSFRESLPEHFNNNRGKWIRCAHFWQDSWVLISFQAASPCWEELRHDIAFCEILSSPSCLDHIW